MVFKLFYIKSLFQETYVSSWKCRTRKYNHLLLPNPSLCPLTQKNVKRGHTINHQNYLASTAYLGPNSRSGTLHIHLLFDLQGEAGITAQLISKWSWRLHSWAQGCTATKEQQHCHPVTQEFSLAERGSNFPTRPGIHWCNFPGKQAGKIHKLRALKIFMTFHPIIIYLI